MKQKQNRLQNVKNKADRNTSKNIAKYSSLSFQMIAIILLFLFGGWELDKYLKWDFPVFTLLLSLIGVFLAIYFAVKDS